MATEGRKLLESWKEISAYLDRSVRTCRRWEASLSLPIHRLDGTPSARVFAYPDELDRWLQEKLHHAEEEEGKEAASRGRKWIFLIAGAAALATVVLAVTLIWHPFPSAPLALPAHNPFLIALPFENGGADKDLEPWRTALPDLIATDLRQSRLVNVLSFPSVYLRLRELSLADVGGFSPEDLKKIAAKVRADQVVLGRLARSADGIVVDVDLLDPREGKAAQSISLIARDENDLFAKTDELSKRLRSALRFSSRQIARDIDRKVSQISTSSPQAFKLFSQACLLKAASRYQEGIPLLEKAVEIDPEFGLAFIHLYDACYFANRLDEMVGHRKRAAELSGRISEKDYLLLQAEFYDSCASIDQRLAGRSEAFSVWRSLGPRDLRTALAVNERLWSLYPDFPEDTGGQLYLLDLYIGLEEWDKIVRVLDRLNLGGFKRPMTVQTIVECYRAMGIYDKAEKTLEDFVRANPGPESDMPSERLALALDQGKFDEASRWLEAEYSPGQKRNYSYYSEAGYICWSRDDLAGAEKAYRTVVDPSNPGEELHRLYNLEVVALSRGQVAKAAGLARRLIDRAKELAASDRSFEDVERAHHYDLSYLYRLAGRLPEALAEAEKACRGYQDRGIAATRELHLRAFIALEMGRVDDFDRLAEEIKRLVEKEARPKYMKVYEHLLGLKELRGGNPGRAVVHLERAQEQVTPGRSFFVETDREPGKYFYTLAEAYRLAGDPWNNKWQIRRNYEKVWQPSAKGSFSGDIYALSFYRMAKLNDSYYLGRGFGWDQYRTGAIENYRKFLSLWGGADPIFPEAEDARARLAALDKR